LKRSELESKLALKMIEEGWPGAKVRRMSEIPSFRPGESLVIEAASKVTRRLCGLFAMEAEIENPEGPSVHRILYKVKPTDQEVVLATETMASLCSPKLGEIYRSLRPLNPFLGSHVRELEIF